MPKSTHRRNGKPRPRRTGNSPAGPLFTYQGRRYRGVARLPDGYDALTLEDRHPDDPAQQALDLLDAALGNAALRQITAADGVGTEDNPATGTLYVEAVTPLVEQICAHYFGDMLANYITARLPGGGAGA